MQDPLFQLEPANCPVCGESKPRPWKGFEVKRRKDVPIIKNSHEVIFKFVQCQNCQHRYMDPAPTEQTLRQYYNNDYFEADNSAGHNRQLRLSWADRFFYRLCRPLPPHKASRVLEIGPGNAKHLLWLKEKGHFVQGLDYGDYPKVIGAESIAIQVGSIDDWQFEEASFDFICCYWVLEHVKDTRPFLEKISRWLKPGGHFVFGVPNVDCPDAKIFGNYWHHAVIPDHISQFSMKSAITMLESHGFKTVSKKYDLLSFDTQLSLSDYFMERWGLNLRLQSNLCKILSLPFAPIKSMLGWSGLVTLVGRK